MENDIKFGISPSQHIQVIEYCIVKKSYTKKGKTDSWRKVFSLEIAAGVINIGM